MSDNPETNEFTLDIKEDSEIFLEFLSEAQDHLEESESNILSIDEDSVDYELINAIFRSIHSIKGSVGFLGLTDMQKLSHELETLLDKARKGEIPFTKKITTLCLNSIDVLRTLRDNLSVKVDIILEGKEDTDKLDNLFDLVGELVIANTLISGEMKSDSNNEHRSNKNLSHLSKITAESARRLLQRNTYRIQCKTFAD